MVNKQYWQGSGAEVRFTHPFPNMWREMILPTMAVLDFGCGYGRIAGELFISGCKNLVGYDCSDTLLVRAQQENPGPQYTSELETVNAQSFDFVLCIGVFTSCPEDREQKEIHRAIDGCTRKGALLLISDNFICDNPRYHSRYAERQLGQYGCFRSGEAVFRHHEREHFDRLFAGWEKQRECLVAAETLNNNPVVVRQLLFRRS
jgi:SAM-dependent methyltransferase